MTQPKQDQDGSWQNPNSSVRPGVGSETPRTSPASGPPPRTGALAPSGSTGMSGAPGTSGASGTSGSYGASGSSIEPARSDPPRSDPPRRTGSTGEPRSTERMREDIARTRSALSEDVAALGNKLDPEHLKESAKEMIHHASSAAREGAKDIVRDAKDAALVSLRDAKDAAFGSLRNAKDHAFESISEGMHQITYRARVAGHTFADFVATHAVPLALAGAGLGWLLLSMSHRRRLLAAGPDYDYEHEGMIGQARSRAAALTSRASDSVQEGRERVVERAHEVQDRVTERAGELRTQIVEGASHLGQKASALGHRAYDGLGKAGRGAIDIGERNPLVTGLLSLAAGVAIALLLPPTRRENELMGGTRDRLVDRAQRSASELKQSVQHGAEEVKGVISEIAHPAAH